MTERDQRRALVLTRWIDGELTSQEAVMLLGLSERQAWRLKQRCLAEGPAAPAGWGHRPGQRGCPSGAEGGAIVAELRAIQILTAIDVQRQAAEVPARP